MTTALERRLARLEAAGGAEFLSADDYDAACARYAAAYHDMADAFPNSMPPAEYQRALEQIRDPKHQRFFACWLPGDNDI